MKDDVYKSERWIEHPENHFRFVGKYQDIYKGRNSHNGWYLDPFQQDTVSGVVYQLTGKDKKPRYIAGHEDGYNEDYVKINVRDIFDEKEDAAREADEMARIYAEKSVEDCIETHAEGAIEENKHKIKEIREIIKEICLELRNIRKSVWKPKQMEFKEEWKGLSQIIYHAVISDIKSKVEEIQSLRKEIRKYEDDPSWCWNQNRLKTNPSILFEDKVEECVFNL